MTRKKRVVKKEEAVPVPKPEVVVVNHPEVERAPHERVRITLNMPEMSWSISANSEASALRVMAYCLTNFGIPGERGR
ncbi:unnamed protein product [marine sediment metagenome]|uniref:Uncharacterized protein n=1 Tax=marine sediment metagenome TaxID=412755 RepID=X1C6R5_9ZZZZ